MTGDLVVRTEERAVVRLDNEQIRYIANTEFVPVGLRGNLPAIMACVATGRALGIDDMSALRSINVIDGRPSLSAELMVMLVRRAGHSIVGSFEPNAAVATGRRGDNGDTIAVTWTMDMAARAGLAGKQNWKRYPESMLWARAVSQLCRMLFADVFTGGTYTDEEFGSETALGEGELGRARSPSPTAAEPGEEDLPEALQSPPPDDPNLISPKQRGRLWTIKDAYGIPESEFRDIVEAHTGQRSTQPIPRAVYDLIVADVEAWTPEYPPDWEKPVEVPE